MWQEVCRHRGTSPFICSRVVSLRIGVCTPEVEVVALPAVLRVFVGVVGGVVRVQARIASSMHRASLDEMWSCRWGGEVTFGCVSLTTCAARFRGSGRAPKI